MLVAANAVVNQLSNKGVGRAIVDLGQKVRGRTPLKYEFEIIPVFAGDIPPGVNRVVFAWERRTKLLLTDPEQVNPNTRAVFWKNYLKQKTTVYTEHGKILPREYSFKLQALQKNVDGEEDRKTIGKVKIDFSQFCTGEVDSKPQELFLQLKPHGKLKVSVKATFMGDGKFDDAATEASGPKSSNWQDYPDDEQNLEGFDNASMASGWSSQLNDGAMGHTVNKKDKGSKRNKGPPSAGHFVAGHIPGGFEIPPTPEEEAARYAQEQEVAREEEMEREYQAIVEAVTAQVQREMAQPTGFAAFCSCCLPRRPPVIPNVYVGEGLGLLPAQTELTIGRGPQVPQMSKMPQMSPMQMPPMAMAMPRQHMPPPQYPNSGYAY